MPTMSGESVSSSVSQPTTTRSAHRAVDESSVAVQSRRKPRWRSADNCGARPSRAKKSIGIGYVLRVPGRFLYATLGDIFATLGFIYRFLRVLCGLCDPSY